jgi:aryl-alcohol dehydrogenase-like predicted oxidoreductase
VGFEKGVEFAQKVEGILRPTAQTSMAQLALRWILDHDAVSSVIPGATKIAQAESNAAASDLEPLPPDVHLSLENLYAEEIAGAIRGAY